MAYVSVAEFKLYKDITGASDDAVITSLLAQAQKMVEMYTGRVFEASANTSRSFDARADVDGVLLFFDRDLVSINTVTNSDGVVVTAGDYVTEPRNGPPYYAIRLKSSSGVRWTYVTDPENSISISGKWAYSETPPADVAWATMRLASYLYEQRKNAGDLDRPVVVAGDMTLLPTRLPRDVSDVLAPYRRLVG